MRVVTHSFNDTAIILGFRGSVAANMYDEVSGIDDVDIMSVVVPPKEYYWGLKMFGSQGTYEHMHEDQDPVVDEVAYEVKKYVSLLMKANPNVISLLWLRPQFYMKMTPEGKILVDNRDLFSTKMVYDSFNGYAYGQLQKMNSPNKFGHMGAKRRELMEKFGYDTKNAAHLVRLLRMGCEFLKTGELNVWRGDAEELLDIKHGKWTADQVKEEAEILFNALEHQRDVSFLPEAPNPDMVNEMLSEIIRRTHIRREIDEGWSRYANV